MGTALNQVTPWAEIHSQCRLAVNRSGITTEPPVQSGVSVVTTSPLTWNRGRMHIARSAAVRPCQPAMYSASRRKLRWVSTTPFGFPVVPDV